MMRRPKHCQAEGCNAEHPPYGFPMPDGKGSITYIQVCERCRGATDAKSKAAMEAAGLGSARRAARADQNQDGERRVIAPPLPDTGGQGRLF